jgi:DNA-binding PadR family transcriptional regulator
MISTGTKRGSAELALLSLLADSPLHGYELARRIEERSGGALRFTLASLYPLLYRLENRGWVRGAWQTLPNGRRRRCYEITSQGRKQLAPMRKEWGMFFRALHKLAGVGRA